MAIGTAAAIALGAGALGSAGIGALSAKSAGKQQVRAAEQGAAEQRAAREELRRLLMPYTEAGTPALQAQMAALGLSGPEAQAAFTAQQEASPMFQELARQGEEAMLQQASATQTNIKQVYELSTNIMLECQRIRECTQAEASPKTLTDYIKQVLK